MITKVTSSFSLAAPRSPRRGRKPPEGESPEGCVRLVQIPNYSSRSMKLRIKGDNDKLSIVYIDPQSATKLHVTTRNLDTNNSLLFSGLNGDVGKHRLIISIFSTKPGWYKIHKNPDLVPMPLRTLSYNFAVFLSASRPRRIGLCICRHCICSKQLTGNKSFSCIFVSSDFSPIHLVKR